MAYEAIAVKQSVTAVLTGEDTSVELTLPGAVSAGSALVVIGGEISTYGTVALLSSVADTSTNTWATPINVRTAGSYSPNVFGALALNVAAGTPTVTLTLGAANSNTNKVSVALIEIEKAALASALDKQPSGTSTGATSTSTADSGALTQTDNIAIICCAGWFGSPSNPSGWSNILAQQNSAYLGALICHKKLTTADALVGTVAHESAAAVSILMLVIKAAAAGGGALQYTFELDDSVFTSADTGITGFVWRNATPNAAAAQRFDALAGDATAGKLHITSGLPTDVAVSDTIYGIFYNGTDTSGLISGVVEST